MVEVALRKARRQASDVQGARALLPLWRLAPRLLPWRQVVHGRPHWPSFVGRSLLARAFLRRNHNNGWRLFLVRLPWLEAIWNVPLRHFNGNLRRSFLPCCPLARCHRGDRRGGVRELDERVRLLARAFPRNQEAPYVTAASAEQDMDLPIRGVVCEAEDGQATAGSIRDTCSTAWGDHRRGASAGGGSPAGPRTGGDAPSSACA
mmetsp:Transcript_54566/g.152222  ORF Transcript_54566/g.152222 Transcript_54566/m.152222 type:complete len:205 (-) Transcript_54566:2-616(-)